MFNSLISLLVVATLLMMSTNVQGANIRLISKGPHGPCNILNYYSGCYNAAYYYCCWGLEPFCGDFTCDGCGEDDTLQAYAPGVNVYPNLGGCSEIIAECAEPCCINLNSAPSCRVNYAYEFMYLPPKEASVRANATQRPCKGVEPNMMSFGDEDGVQYEIHVPKGTYETAVSHFKEANWTALKSFPKWANQHYEDDDVEDGEIAKRDSFLDGKPMLAERKEPLGVSGVGGGLARKDGSVDGPTGIDDDALLMRNDLDSPLGVDDDALLKRNDTDDQPVPTGVEGEEGGEEGHGGVEPPPYPCHKRGTWKRLRCLLA